MDLIKDVSIDGLSVLVYDNVIPLSFVEDLKQEAINGSWSLNSDYEDTDRIPFIYCLDHNSFSKRNLFKNISNLIDISFNAGKMYPYNVSYNSGNPGDTPWEHQDGFTKGVFDITVIIYVNTEWNKNWGGETVYYNNDGEVALSVLPKPGRVVIHEARINHASRPPTNAMEEIMRFTLAIKCTNNKSYAEKRIAEEL
jgi:Rps23 Pro-64 3,4-dihydroxylase Tpa1-like proline 4-hydroxylase